MATVKMTNAEVKALIDCLEKFAASGIKLSPKLWYYISRNKNMLDRANKDIEVARVSIVKEYIKSGESRVPQEHIEAFQSKYNELLQVETELEIKQIRMETLEEEMDKLNGVSNIYMFFEYLVEGLPEDQPKEKEVAA